MVEATVEVQPAKPAAQNAPIPDPFVLVIFGASGDLATRRLIPALFQLYQEKLLPKNFAVLGFSRTPWDDDTFRTTLFDLAQEVSRVKPTKSAWEGFAKNLFYISGEYDKMESYIKLKETLKKVNTDCQTQGNHLFYLATPPSLYLEIVKQLGAGELVTRTTNGFVAKKGWSRIIIEKPFGRDIKTAQDLNLKIHQVFAENQVYRIDHYLGKETVQNILIFRFANKIFEPVWNNRYIEHIQITTTETQGVEHRGGYYEETGALRDMFQNHMLQLLCLVAMEPPSNFDPESVLDEKVKVLKSVRPLAAKEIKAVAVRGQYNSGKIGGAAIAGYREEPKVSKTSHTETYAAVKLQIDNWRWEGVPFYLRSGKRLKKKVSEIAITFKEPPHVLFKTPVKPNTLVFRIQPDEGIALTFDAKRPGTRVTIDTVAMDFPYAKAFGTEAPDAYERLILDALLGDPTLFARHDWIEKAWGILDPILKEWKNSPEAALPSYPAGSWGPKEADEILENSKHQWRET